MYICTLGFQHRASRHKQAGRHKAYNGNLYFSLETLEGHSASTLNCKKTYGEKSQCFCIQLVPETRAGEWPVLLFLQWRRKPRLHWIPEQSGWSSSSCAENCDDDEILQKWILQFKIKREIQTHHSWTCQWYTKALLPWQDFVSSFFWAKVKFPSYLTSDFLDLVN